MSATFEDFLNAGRLDEKTITVRGMEVTVKPLTLAENAKIEKLREAGDSAGAILAMIGFSVVSPKMSEAELKKLNDCSAAFIGDLASAIGEALKIEKGAAEKN